MLGPWRTHLKWFVYHDFVSDNDWFIWKYLNGFLLFKINILMFMGTHIKYLVKACSLQLRGENSLAPPIHI
jgi:hypothetical protein